MTNNSQKKNEERSSTERRNNKPLILTWKDIQSLLLQLRGNYDYECNPHWHVSLQHRPLQQRLLDRTPTATIHYGRHQVETVYTQVTFLVDREGKLMENSCVTPKTNETGDFWDEYDLPQPREPECIWDAVRRVDRRQIGAVVIATYNWSHGNEWLTTAYYAPSDQEELVRWNRERRRQTPRRGWSGIKGERPRKAGKFWH